MIQISQIGSDSSALIVHNEVSGCHEPKLQLHCNECASVAIERVEGHPHKLRARIQPVRVYACVRVCARVCVRLFARVDCRHLHRGTSHRVAGAGVVQAQVSDFEDSPENIRNRSKPPWSTAL